MTDYERKIRTYFNLKLEGKICEKCWERFVDNYKIDNLLKLYKRTQTKEMAIYVKSEIMKINVVKANTMFPEISL
tara:strand:- start:1374 stop:1598 length:225 start_codon:yes stop_codon:yes gene_type:complete